MANKIWFIEEEQIKQYPGTYAEYEIWNSKRVIPAAKSIPVKPAEKEVKPKAEDKPVTVNTQQQLKKLNDQLQKIEQETVVLDQEVKAIEAELADEKVYSDQVKLAEANKKYIAAKALLDDAQDKWETLAAEIMELETA